jgi:hypothetical protein
MKPRRPTQLILTLLLTGIMISSIYAPHLLCKSTTETYNTTHPPGELEINIKQTLYIEDLKAHKEHIGEIHAWTYSNNTELTLKLIQESQNIDYNTFAFRELTVEICLPLDMIFIIDLTHTTPQFMDLVKKNLIRTVNFLSLTHKAPLRFGVVAFKDYPWQTQQLLTDDYEAVKAFIDKLTTQSDPADPQSHHLSLDAALNDFNSHSRTTNARIVIFISDTQAEYNNAPSLNKAKEKADKMAELGIEIHAVSCRSNKALENRQLKYYANITGGQFIELEGQNSIFSGVTSRPTWKVALTPLAPNGSFPLRLNSSPPCQKEGHYTFHAYLSFYADTIPRHNICFKLMAELEKR